MTNQQLDRGIAYCERVVKNDVNNVNSEIAQVSATLCMRMLREMKDPNIINSCSICARKGTSACLACQSQTIARPSHFKIKE